MTAPRKVLQAAYQATSYLVDGPGGRFAIRTGQPSPEANSLLDVFHVQTWAFVTACNPGSRPQTPEVNEQRHQDLVDVVKGRFPFFTGAGQGEAGDWPAERSLLILGISRVDARQLALQFGQLALVFGRRGEIAELVWTDEEPP